LRVDDFDSREIATDFIGLDMVFVDDVGFLAVENFL
jgi:hypothetical protein